MLLKKKKLPYLHVDLSRVFEKKLILLKFQIRIDLLFFLNLEIQLKNKKLLIKEKNKKIFEIIFFVLVN